MTALMGRISIRGIQMRNHLDVDDQGLGFTFVFQLHTLQVGAKF
jgi:hypothetical protein